jgi:D-3-phosphoglycerate dehydrogenase / 2-oxoglutarate reductase
LPPPPPIRTLITAPVRGEGLDKLRALGEVVLDPWIEQTPLRLYDAEKLAARLGEEEANVVVCEADRCAGPVFELPLVAVASTRGDPTNVDIEAATAAGIPVLHAPGRNADAVAELTVGLLLAVSRGIVAADEDVRNDRIYRDGTIPYQRFRSWELRGRTVGIVGLGAVGRATAWRLEALGMRVISTDPYAEGATHTLQALLAEADVVSLHAPVTAGTKGMIGEKEFEAMRDGAIYLNSARADLHDEDALVAALSEGKLAGAALDHFSGERLDPEHPLASMDNVVLTPHIGGATYNTEANHSRMVADDLERLLAGERPTHIANPEVLG